MRRGKAASFPNKCEQETPPTLVCALTEVRSRAWVAEAVTNEDAETVRADRL